MKEVPPPLAEDRGGEGEIEPHVPTKNTATAVKAITAACGAPPPSDKSAATRFPTVVPSAPTTLLAGTPAEVSAMLSASEPARVTAGADATGELLLRRPSVSGERRSSFGGRSGRTRRPSHTIPGGPHFSPGSPRRHSSRSPNADLRSLASDDESFMSSLAGESNAAELAQKLDEAAVASGFSRIYAPLRQPSPNAEHNGPLVGASPTISERSVVFSPSGDEPRSPQPLSPWIARAAEECAPAADAPAASDVAAAKDGDPEPDAATEATPTPPSASAPSSPLVAPRRRLSLRSAVRVIGAARRLKKRRRVLLVHEDAGALRTMQQMLAPERDTGAIAVDCAASASEAHRLLDRHGLGM